MILGVKSFLFVQRQKVTFYTGKGRSRLTILNLYKTVAQLYNRKSSPRNFLRERHTTFIFKDASQLYIVNTHFHSDYNLQFKGKNSIVLFRFCNNCRLG